MALLDKDKVGGHGGGMGHSHPLPPGEYFDIAALPQGEPVTGVVLRDLGTRPVYELRTPKGIRLVDATDGADIRVDEGIARAVASMMNEATIRTVSVIAKPNLQAPDHPGATRRAHFSSAAPHRGN